MSGRGSLLPLALSVGSEGRERCLRRGIRTSPLSGETEMQLYFCRSPIAGRSPDISGLCQTPSPNWATLWSLHLQEIWQCLTETRHQTHPSSRGTVFSSLFLAKELSLHLLHPTCQRTLCIEKTVKESRARCCCDGANCFQTQPRQGSIGTGCPGRL